MGFFSDLKEDLSQAANELMSDALLGDDLDAATEETAAAKQSSEAPVTESTPLVNPSFLGGASENVSLEEMLKNIDSYELPAEDTVLPETEVADAEATAQDDLEEPALEEMAAETMGYEEPALEEPGEIDESFLVEEPAVEESAVEGSAVEEPVAEEIAAEEPAVEDTTVEDSAAEEPAADEPATEESFDIKEPESEEAVETEDTEDTDAVMTADDTNKDKGAFWTMDMDNKLAADETALITAGMIITGDIASEGSMDIVGTINGNIDILGKLNITGYVTGNSKAAEIFAEGAKINGEIISEGSVKIGASSVIIGNITATSAAIAGAVKGDIDVKGPVVLDSSAIVMGNIKSKSVQINNGAVIEGMCSQCYADVSPTSFFDEYKPEKKTSTKSK